MNGHQWPLIGAAERVPLGTGSAACCRSRAVSLSSLPARLQV